MSDAAAPRRYAFSGNLGRGLTVIPILGIPTALAAGFASGFLNHFVISLSTVPVKLTSIILFLVSLGLGMGLGHVVVIAARRARCRSAALVSLAGFVLGCGAVYCAWAVVCWQLFNEASIPVSIWDVLIAPDSMWQLLSAIWTTGGVGVLIVGAVEALTIIAAAAYVAHSEFPKKVFCESCLLWIQQRPESATFAYPLGNADLEQRVRQGDLEAVRQLPRSDALPLIRVDQSLCDGCRNMGTYRFVQMSFQPEQPKPLEADLTGHLLITPENAVSLAMLDNVPPPSAETDMANAAPAGLRLDTMLCQTCAGSGFVVAPDTGRTPCPSCSNTSGAPSQPTTYGREGT